MNVEQARERLGLLPPSPAQRNRIERDARKNSLRSKYVTVPGSWPPPAKSAKKSRKQKRNKHYPKPKKQSPKPPEDMPRYAGSALRWLVWTRDAGQCQYCGIEVSYTECNIDHVMPWPLGFTVKENLVVACNPCNALKYSQIIPKHLRPDTGEVTAK